MKYSGSVLDFTEERNEALMGAYRAVIGSREVLSLAEISERIVNRPCSRFWVSEGRAAVIISEMLKGNPILYTMRETKQEMFQEIYRRVVSLREKHPKASLAFLVKEVIYSPAPKFYMRPRCAMEIIYKLKRDFYKNKVRCR